MSLRVVGVGQGNNVRCSYPHFCNCNILTFETSNLICIYIVSLHIHLDSKTQRTHGRQAQIGNIAAARAVADIIRSTLGPRSMLKVRR